MTRTCGGCGGALAGRRRRWCSEACRVWRSRHGSAARPAGRPCARAGCDSALPSGRQLWCSDLCEEISHGKRRAEPLPAQRCALQGCGAGFTPHRSDQRCCSEAHGKALYNREHRAGRRSSSADLYRYHVLTTGGHR